MNKRSLTIILNFLILIGMMSCQTDTEICIHDLKEYRIPNGVEADSSEIFGNWNHVLEIQQTSIWAPKLIWIFKEDDEGKYPIATIDRTEFIQYDKNWTFFRNDSISFINDSIYFPLRDNGESDGMYDFEIHNDTLVLITYAPINGHPFIIYDCYTRLNVANPNE